MSTNPSLDLAAKILQEQKKAPRVAFLYGHLAAIGRGAAPYVRFLGAPSTDNRWHDAPSLLIPTAFFSVWVQGYSQRLAALQSMNQRYTALVINAQAMSYDERVMCTAANFVQVLGSGRFHWFSELGDIANVAGKIIFNLEDEAKVFSLCKSEDLTVLQLDLCSMLLFNTGIPDRISDYRKAVKELASEEFNYTLWRFLRFRRDVFSEVITPINDRQALTLIDSNCALLYAFYELGRQESIDLMKESIVKRRKHLFNDVRRKERHVKQGFKDVDACLDAIRVSAKHLERVRTELERDFIATLQGGLQ